MSVHLSKCSIGGQGCSLFLNRPTATMHCARIKVRLDLSEMSFSRCYPLVALYYYLLCTHAVDSDIVVIRPSDHLLSGTDYHLYSRREFPVPDLPQPPSSPGQIHHIIRRPSDVSVDAPYATDFWGEVDFPPVPRFSIDTHDPVAQDIYVSGSVHAGKEQWDVFVWNSMVSLLQQHGTPGHTPLVVDVGANLGYFSLAAASLGAHVIAFEPMSRNARKFSKSVQRNKFEERITLFQNVVWDDVASVRLSLQPTDVSNQGNGRVTAEQPSKSTSSGSKDNDGVYGVDYASTTSLSHVVLEDVDILKIDVEGSESVVIAGARRLICNFSVKHILMEFTEVKKRTGTDSYSATAMLNFLESVGYAVSDVTPDAVPLSVADFENFPPNILFTLKGSRAVC